jgi:hypothetical protein
MLPLSSGPVRPEGFADETVSGISSSTISGGTLDYPNIGSNASLGVDLFSFKVTLNSGRAYSSSLNRCELSRGNFNTYLTDDITVNSTGWTIGTTKSKCDGKWDKK